MRIKLILAGMFCLPLLAGQSVSKVAFTESNHTIRAFSPSGEVTLAVVRVQLDIRYPGGKNELGNLVVVHDSENGHYFWRYQSVTHPGDTRSFLGALESQAEGIYAAPDGLVEFVLPGALYAKEHTERVHNLDAAETAAINEIRSGMPAFEKSGYHTDARKITVGDAIGMDFFCAPFGDREFSQGCGGSRGTKFKSITRQAGNWRLVVQNRWDQEVILDAKFNVVSTRRLPDPAKEH